MYVYVLPDLTFKNSEFYPHSVFYVFCVGNRTYSYYLPVHFLFVLATDTDWVYCAVRTEYLNTIQVHHHHHLVSLTTGTWSIASYKASSP